MNWELWRGRVPEEIQGIMTSYWGKQMLSDKNNKYPKILTPNSCSFPPPHFTAWNYCLPSAVY